ncbi:MAG TPA: beta-L-arabinofuranosidase domain-containing protein [Pyrinomonadaceae bacterium]|jgi:hypothetical protein
MTLGVSISTHTMLARAEVLGQPKKQKSAITRAQPFDLKEIRLLEGPFKDAMQRDQKFILQLDPDRLLHNFRVNAGLPSTAKPLGGWEAPNIEIRGHFVGHYLSACSLMYASTGDEQFKRRVNYVVRELAKCQAALPSKGYHQGYLSAFPESFFDKVDRREPVWAPYYTLHKIMAGLLDGYLYCGNRKALDVLEKIASWLQFRVGRLTHEQMQGALRNEYGGMNELLTNLYAVTAEPEYLQLAHAFDHEVVFTPLSRGEDCLEASRLFPHGVHANMTIPKIIGAAREYELTGETQFRDISTFFWQLVALHRSYVTGENSDKEYFFPIEDFSQHLSPAAGETCNTYNMLKLTRHVFAWEPKAETMDFYERALFNHILGSQDPETGRMIYFASLKPGHFKVYNTAEDSFWCCTGTGMENHAKYGDTIYFHDADSLYLNLFISSELNWKQKGLRLRQETRFPEADTTRLTFRLKKPIKLGLKIRYPGWAQNLIVKVNDQVEKIQATPGSYVTIQREWHEGDRMDVRFPMALHLESLPYAPNTVAVLYGPIVLAGELGIENLPDVYVRDHSELNNWPAPSVPAFASQPQELTSKIEPVVGKALTFQTKGLGHPRDVELIPFYLLHHQRYNVYWQVLSDEEFQKRKRD